MKPEVGKRYEIGRRVGSKSGVIATCISVGRVGWIFKADDDGRRIEVVSAGRIIREVPTEQGVNLTAKNECKEMTDSTNPIHDIGTAARKALSALKSAKAAKKMKTAKANELIEERNELVKPLLIRVRDYLAAGGTVNGHSTWSAWAKASGWSKRALNYIVNGRKPQNGNSSSRKVTLKEGMTITVRGREITLDARLLTLLIEYGAVKEEEREPASPTVKTNEVLIQMDKEESLHAAAADLEKTLEAIEPIIMTDENKQQQCDYTEDEVAAMFAKGGK